MNKIKISEDELYVAYAQKLIKHMHFSKSVIYLNNTRKHTLFFSWKVATYTPF